MRYILLTLLFVSSQSIADSLFNFHVGTSWTYKVEVKNKESYETTNKVVSVITVDGKNWYELVEFGETFWVANNEYGQVEAVNFFEKTPSEISNISKAEEKLFLKYPAKVGERWRYLDTIVIYLGIKKITVPAGDFSCHMYKIYMGGRDYSSYCIAKDVGIVYEESKYGDDPKEISRLIKFKQ